VEAMVYVMKWEPKDIRRQRWKKWYAWHPVRICDVMYLFETVYRRQKYAGDEWRWQYTTFEALIFATENPEMHITVHQVPGYERVPGPPAKAGQSRYSASSDQVEIFDGDKWISMECNPYE
jgi:hypothetical protein